YVWSKALEVAGTGYTDPTNREKDYTLNVNDVRNDFRANGTVALPIGPNRLLFGQSSGWMARVVEGWQASFIVNLSSGQPGTVAAGNMLYANGTPDPASPFSLHKGKVNWSGDYGNYFGTTTFGKTTDPQCAAVAVDLKPYCTLQAVTNAGTGQVILQNAQPGTRGIVGRQTLSLPGAWAFDAAMSKSLRIGETKSVQIRMDATDILNHPTPSSPNLNINNTNSFGFIQD